MAPVAVAALGLAFYAMSVYVSWLAALLLGIIAVVILILFLLAGAFLRHGNPVLSACLMLSWSLVVVVVAAGVAASAIYLGTLLVAGDDASDATKGMMAGGGALATLVATSLKDWLNKKLAPWFCYMVLKEQYLTMFPCTPQGLGPGRLAQQLVSTRCVSFSEDQWRRKSVQDLMVRVQAAVAVGEFQGGPNWQCL